MTFSQETEKPVRAAIAVLIRMSDTPTTVASRGGTLRSVVLFTTLVLALASVAPQLGGNAQRPGPGFILWGLSPFLVAVGLRLVSRDWADLGMRPGLRRHARWYLLSFLVWPAVLALILLASTATGTARIEGFDAGRFFGLALVALVGLFIPALVEEFGWRGYLAPKLAALGIDRYVGHVLTGVVWATWHLPFVSGFDWRFGAEGTATLAPRFYLICIALSVVYGEIRAATATFWPAVLMHATGNAFGHLLALDYVRVQPGQQWLGSVSTSIVAILAFAILGVGIHRWRTHRASPVIEVPAQ
jgi:membrane protease YdiL (CAAX protease family)